MNGPLVVAGAVAAAAAVLPRMNSRGAASVASALAAAAFAVLMLYHTGPSAAYASATVLLAAVAVFPPKGVFPPAVPFFLSAAFLSAGPLAALLSVSALAMSVYGAASPGLAGRFMYFAAGAVLLYGPSARAGATGFFIFTALAAVSGFAFMEKKGASTGGVAAVAAAAFVLTGFMGQYGAYVMPRAALPVILALLAMSLYRAVTEDSAEGLASGSGIPFFLLYIFFLSSGVMPHKGAAMLPAAGLAALFPALEFASRNPDREHAVDALRYWKERAGGKGFAVASIALFGAAEITLVALVLTSVKPDQFIYALSIFAAGAYSVSMANRFFILVSALSHMAADKKRRPAAAGFPVFRAAVFASMAAAVIARSLL